MKWRKLIEFYSRQEHNCFWVAADRGRQTTKHTLTNKPSAGEICAQIYTFTIIAVESNRQRWNRNPGYCWQQTWRTGLEKWLFWLRSHKNEEQKRRYYHSPFPLRELNIRIMLPSIKKARRWGLAGGIPLEKRDSHRSLLGRWHFYSTGRKSLLTSSPRTQAGPCPLQKRQHSRRSYSRNYL